MQNSFNKTSHFDYLKYKLSPILFYSSEMEIKTECLNELILKNMLSTKFGEIKSNFNINALNKLEDTDTYQEKKSQCINTNKNFLQLNNEILINSKNNLYSINNVFNNLNQESGKLDNNGLSRILNEGGSNLKNSSFLLNFQKNVSNNYQIRNIELNNEEKTFPRDGVDTIGMNKNNEINFGNSRYLSNNVEKKNAEIIKIEQPDVFNSKPSLIQSSILGRSNSFRSAKLGILQDHVISQAPADSNILNRSLNLPRIISNNGFNTNHIPIKELINITKLQDQKRKIEQIDHHSEIYSSKNLNSHIKKHSINKFKKRIILSSVAKRKQITTRRKRKNNKNRKNSQIKIKRKKVKSKKSYDDEIESLKFFKNKSKIEVNNTKKLMIKDNNINTNQESFFKVAPSVNIHTKYNRLLSKKKKLKRFKKCKELKVELVGEELKNKDALKRNTEYLFTPVIDTHKLNQHCSFVNKTLKKDYLIYMTYGKSNENKLSFGSDPVVIYKNYIEWYKTEKQKLEDNSENFHTAQQNCQKIEDDMNKIRRTVSMLPTLLYPADANKEPFNAASKKKKINNGKLINKTFTCEICGQVFDSGQGLGGHWSRKHKGESEKFKKKKETRDKREEIRESTAIAKGRILKEKGYNYENICKDKNGKKLIKEVIAQNRNKYKIYLEEEKDKLKLKIQNN